MHMSDRIIKDDEYFKNIDLSHSFDSLTKVLNREAIFGYIDSLIERKIPFSFLISDLDNFKYVNDTYGHIVGDKVLVKIGENFIQQLNKFGVVGRFGGDEFIMVVPEIVDYDCIWKICKEICFSVNDIKIDELMGSNISNTMGLSRYPEDGKDRDILMLKADRALYRGKQKGRNCFIIYLHEKHANIDVGDYDKLKFKSMDIHAKIYKTLTSSSNFADNIKSVLYFISSTLMIDHLCIQSRSKVCRSVVYPLSPVKSFSMIRNDLMDGLANADGLCILNSISQLDDLEQKELRECNTKQKIGGGVYVKIEAYGKEYGFLRAETANQNGRIWQDKDVDILVVMSKLLGVLLYYNDIDLDTIF